MPFVESLSCFASPQGKAQRVASRFREAQVRRAALASLSRIAAGTEDDIQQHLPALKRAYTLLVRMESYQAHERWVAEAHAQLIKAGFKVVSGVRP